MTNAFRLLSLVLLISIYPTGWLHSQVSSLSLSPSVLTFDPPVPGEIQIAEVRIRSRGRSAIINKVVCNHPAFQLPSPIAFPVELNADSDYVFPVLYDPIDAHYTTGWLSFEVDGMWDATLFLEAGDTAARRPLVLNPPKVTLDEEIGNSLDITWGGCFSNDAVRIRFSPDNGRTWQQLTDSATGFRFTWNFPLLYSDSCLLEIEHGDKADIAYVPILISGVKQSFDRWGNAYLAGTFSTTVAFHDTILEGSGTEDSFIASLRSDGSFRWLKTITGSESNAIFAFRASDRSSYYLIDGDPEPGTIEDSIRLPQPALLKLDNLTGQVLWVAPDSTLPGTGYYSMYLDSRENTFIVGRGNGSSILTRKIDSSGTTLWSSQINASSTLIYGQFVDVAPDDWIAVGGIFNGSIETERSVVQARGREDGVVALLDPAGNTEWVKTIGSNRADLSVGVGFSHDGSILFVSRFIGDTLFIDDDTAVPLGREYGAVVGAFSRAGELLWIDRIDCDGDCRFGAPVWRPEEDVIVISGSVNDTIWFAENPLLVDRAFNNFGSFYATYTSSGQLLCFDRRPRYSLPGDHTLFGSMFSWGDSLNRAYLPLNCLPGYSAAEDRRVVFAIQDPSGVGTEGREDNHILQLRPNPASGYTVLELAGGIRGTLRIEVMDVTGSTLLHQSIESDHASGSIRLDLSHLPNGVYGVRVEDATGTLGYEMLRIER